MTRLTVNGRNYNVAIEGTGIPLVLLHGFTGSAANWEEVAAFLSLTYTVIAIDLPGHGCSDAPADPDLYRIELVAADLALLFERLAACPVNLLGYSMGGRLALYMARHYPELIRSLVLESASPGLADPRARDERRASDDALARRIEQDGLPAFVDYWESIPLFASQQRLPEATRQQLRAQRLTSNPVGLANSLRGMGTGQQPSLWEDLPLIQQPTLLLAGELDDKFVGIARAMGERLPHAQVQIMPGVGHTIHLEMPEAYLMQVLMFVHMAQFAPSVKDDAVCPTPSLHLTPAVGRAAAR